MAGAETLTAPVAEVFSSIQGEGLLAGARQVFVRLRGCDLDCPYCDTPAARGIEGPCEAETTPGGGTETLDNPLTVAQAAELVRRLVEADRGLHHSIALTGGEPLLHADFVAALATELRPLDLPVMLETNGRRPADLKRVLSAVDMIAMDFKLPGAMGRPLDPDVTLEFLRLAQPRRVFVKMVVTDGVSPDEIEQTCRLVASVDPACPVFLQPVTPVVEGIRPPAARELLEMNARAARHLHWVRVVPQMHRMLGVR
ncbi:MAG: 7-carboxy-7-deazaguanine synthase QueE [Armatimonadetes bacterium]|nr:7-carboxy-7-deazaguanine synthase QueE [Armatimonadota bacterium]